MSEHGRLLLQTLELLVAERLKPPEQRSPVALESYRDAVLHAMDAVMEHEPNEPPKALPKPELIGA